MFDRGNFNFNGLIVPEFEERKIDDRKGETQPFRVQIFRSRKSRPVRESNPPPLARLRVNNNYYIKQTGDDVSSGQDTGAQNSQEMYCCVFCRQQIRSDHLLNHRLECKYVQISDPTKTLVCCVCKYATYNIGNYKKHIFHHTGEKPYKCDFCDYKSAQSCHVKVHMRIRHDYVA
uniref:RE1-silencing transcription factor n=1 Tax=Cacopsylla melanoneura TaxID=428564 RepID=A0A8D9DXE8_9HEMI